MISSRVASQLSKLRLSGLVASTAGFGFIAAGNPIDGLGLAAAVSGTFLTSCSASTFNQIIEIRSDALMKRTRLRPLPSGRISSSTATLFGLSTGAVGLAMLYAGTNPLTAAFGLANLALYTNAYTPLKKITTFNTEIGAVVGAIPPVMGWTAATGTCLAPEAAALASILFLWQMPHFLSLAWVLRQDYAAGGYRMRSLNDLTGATSSATLVYSSLLLAVPIATSIMGMTSMLFAAHGTLANMFLVQRAWRFHSEATDENARALFRTSLWQLPLLLGLFAFHNTNRNAIAELDGIHELGKRLCLHEGFVATSMAKDLCLNSISPTDLTASQHTAQ